MMDTRAIQRRLLLAAPTVEQLHEALSHSYQAASAGPFGLALIAGGLWVTVAPGTPQAADESLLDAVTTRWRELVCGTLCDGLQARGSLPPDRRESRVRSTILGSPISTARPSR